MLEFSFAAHCSDFFRFFDFGFERAADFWGNFGFLAISLQFLFEFVIFAGIQEFRACFLARFGKLKFTGTTRRDQTYIASFLVNQPIPTFPGNQISFDLPLFFSSSLHFVRAINVPLNFA